MSVRTMYDSVNPAALPLDGDLYAGYVDGRATTGNALAVQRRFPHKRVVGITVTGGTLLAQVADVELGDLTPASGAAWAARKVRAQQHPTLYSNLSTWPAVLAAVNHAGIAGRVSFWIAHYDGDPTLPAGVVAKQYLGDFPDGHGGTFDKSSVAAYWPGVDPPPAPPAPHPLQEDIVRLYRVQGTDPVWITDYIRRRWVESPAELAQIVHDTGLQPIVLPPGSTFLTTIPVEPGTPVPR